MAEEFQVTDEEFKVLKGHVVVITGCSSGIGLATTKLLLSIGAKVVGGDLNTPPIKDANLIFQATNVTSWADLTSLFNLAQSSYGGRIDHVFANAGIGPTTTYVDLETDSSGQLIEPTFRTFDVNLRGVINTSALAFHYMKKQSPSGGSVVLTASASAFQRFLCVDYATAKHGVLGFMRGMYPIFKRENIPVRINTIGPSWTRSGLVPEGLTEAAGKATQSADVVARGVVVLMADQRRDGHFIYTVDGRHKEIEESVLLKAVDQIVEGDLDDNTVMERIMAMGEEQSRRTAEAKALTEAKVTGD